jgi:hypothetical protein
MSEPVRLVSLPSIEAAIWQELQRATHDRHHEWRVPVLASVAADGSADARSVVLREVLPAQRRLVFYTDDRSPKLAQLRLEPRATLVCWSRRLGWQLRLRVHCRPVADEAELAARWQRVVDSPAAADYLAQRAPGTELAGDTGADSRPHFAVVEAEVVATDWLELHRAGHRRAAVDAAGSRWLQP